MTQRPLTARGHHHVEAFCLMQYACPCGHAEVMWNSRDGVTPFSLACPSCGQANLHHVKFRGDVYAPKHVPHDGQRVWVAMTEERATSLAIRNVARVKRESGVDYTARVPSLVTSYWQEGQAPDLRISGIDYHHPEC
ncbi:MULTISPECIES: hypothetical protein [unclassified Cupriavidus]|uniref:hypothetical protein n=1 Tax=unclassified Cupriavidus TaxID=2640874 RepID=UPI00313E0E86